MPKSDKQFPLRRRDLLKGGASLAAASGLPGGLVGTATAAANTLVIAAPATPQSLDCNFDVSLGTFEAIAVLYDNLLEFKKISRPEAARRFPRGHRRSSRPARRPRHSRQARGVVCNSTRAGSSFVSICVRVSRATGAMNSPPKT